MFGGLDLLHATVGKASVDSCDGSSDLIRTLLGQVPGLTEDDSGLYVYTHDPKAIAEALGDPPEIFGWREWVAQ